jgi:DNA-binding transcriptional LysR family regulator
MIQSSLRRLEVFAMAAECGSFAAASERLNIAQPSVSAHVAALERAVGGQLFLRRRGSKPVLTDLGQSVLKHAQDMLAKARDLSQDALNIHAGGDQRVILSCQRSLANFTLNRGLTSFALKHPAIQLVVRIGRQEDVLTDMREARSDIGCFLSNEEYRGLASVVIGRQELLFIASPDHPLAGHKAITADMLSKQAFVGPPPDSHFGQSITRKLAASGIRNIRTVAQATEYQFLRELVAARVGIACSPAASIASDVAAGTLVALDVDVPPITLDIRLLTSITRPASEPMQRLSNFLQEVIRSSL